MLTMMRAMLRSKASGGLFVLLIVAMAAWGVTDIFAGPAANRMISAGERTISPREFDTTLDRILQNATDSRGRSLTKEQALDQGIVDQLFAREQQNVALMAYADKLGASATTMFIDETIRQNPSFQDTTGLYDSNLYVGLLQQNNIRADDFRKGLETEETIARLQGMPIAGLKVPAALARLQAAYTSELREASYFALNQSALPEIGDPTDEQLQELFETRKSALREPERRAISIIRLSADDYISSVEVPENDIVAFYEAYKGERYTGPDSRRFIDFTFSDEATARAALGRIAGGAEPEAITTALSTGERTGRKEIVTNPRLADQVFARGALPGSIHGPQPVGSNFLVIRLEDVISGDETPLEVVREEISNELARELAVAEFYDALPQFDDLIGTGSDLEAIAQGLGTPVLSFAAVDQNGVAASGARFPPILEAPELLQKVFERPEGSKTERLGDDETTWMARVDVIQPEREPDFEEVREVLEFAWRQQEQSEQLQKAATAVETAILDGTSTLSEEAAKYATIVQDLPGPVSRQSNDIQLPPQLVNGLFAARNPGETFSTPGLPGEIIVMQVTNINRPAPETLDLLAEGTAASIQDSVGNDLFNAYFVGIQTDVDLKSNGAAYEAYKRGLRTQQ
jgi:peptidyl-prolyl cis-trans isomerase D